MAETCYWRTPGIHGPSKLRSKFDGLLLIDTALVSKVLICLHNKPKYTGFLSVGSKVDEAALANKYTVDLHWTPLANKSDLCRHHH